MDKRFNKVGFIFGKFINSYVEGGRFIRFPCGQLEAFVISNSLIDWSNKEKIEEEFNDKTYNYFKKVISPYNHKWIKWWVMEIVRNKFIIYEEDKNMEECPISFGETNCITMCGHRFDRGSLYKANEEIKLGMFHKCPMCRSTLSQGKIKNKYFSRLITNEPFTECICNKRYYEKGSNKVRFCGNGFIGEGSSCYICRHKNKNSYEEFYTHRFIDTYNVYIDSDNEGYYIVDNMGQEFRDYNKFISEGHYGSDYGESASSDNQEVIATLDFVVEGGLNVSVIDEEIEIEDLNL
tara:strand:+ start:235 stop:1113 length:879 start_codon:yes stop_codon:yes gene_type:complete